MVAWRRKTKVVYRSKIHPSNAQSYKIHSRMVKNIDTFSMERYRCKGMTETDLYVKPTDSHHCLFLTSFHPFCHEKGIQITRH